MSNFFIGVIVVIVSVIAFVTYRRLQETKAQAAKLVSLNNSVRQIQDRYKTALSNLASENFIDGETRRKLVTVGNNYFVFQPVNAINLAHLMDLVDVFINASEGHFEDPKVSDARLTELLVALAGAIPDSTRDFSSHYYLNYAPGLFFEFSNQVKDDIHDGAPQQAATEPDDSDSVTTTTEAEQTTEQDDANVNTTPDKTNLQA